MRDWSPDEIVLIKQLFYAGTSIEKIAVEVQRPSSTVRHYCATHGLKKFTGCDEDCFNCEYPDCMKPAYLIKNS